MQNRADVSFVLHVELSQLRLGHIRQHLAVHAATVEHTGVELAHATVLPGRPLLCHPRRDVLGASDAQISSHSA